jgi:hypothetical protein
MAKNPADAGGFLAEGRNGFWQNGVQDAARTMAVIKQTLLCLAQEIGGFALSRPVVT